MKRFPILFCDLDGTLIKKKTKKDNSPCNMEINFNLIDKIELMQPDYVFIVTNQGNVGKTVTEKEFEAKLDFVCACITYQMRKNGYSPKCVESIYCPSDDPENKYRKPNTGMLEALCNAFKLLDNYKLTDMLMIGDSSGLDEHGDADYMLAKNFDICYCDVNEFLKIHIFENK